MLVWNGLAHARALSSLLTSTVKCEMSHPKAKYSSLCTFSQTRVHTHRFWWGSGSTCMCSNKQCLYFCNLLFQVALFPLIHISKPSWVQDSCLCIIYWKPTHCSTLRYHFIHLLFTLAALFLSFCLWWWNNLTPSCLLGLRCIHIPCSPWHNVCYCCHLRWATARACPSLLECCFYTWGKKMPSTCSNFLCMM